MAPIETQLKASGNWLSLRATTKHSAEVRGARDENLEWQWLKWEQFISATCHGMRYETAIDLEVDKVTDKCLSNRHIH